MEVPAQPSSYHNACTEALKQTRADPLHLEQILGPVVRAVPVAVCNDPAGEHGANPGQRLEIARPRVIEVDACVLRPRGGGTVGSRDALTVAQDARLVHPGGVRRRRKPAGGFDGISGPRSRWNPVNAGPDHGAINLNDQLSLRRLLEDANGGRGTAGDEEHGAARDDRGCGDEDDKLLGAGPPQPLRLRPPPAPTI